MRMKATSRKAPVAVLFALLVISGSSIVSYAQGRGNGRGAAAKNDKCAKFVNCHDARDGRWDGRGPAINQGNTIPVWQPPVNTYPNGPVRTRNQNNQIYYPRTRNRRVQRNSDNNDANSNTTWRRRRTGSDTTATRDRRTRHRDRSSVIE